MRAAAKGVSLHIGVNILDPEHYAGWNGKLSCCENDCDDIQAIAREQGFETHLLKSENATREAVKSKIGEIAKQLSDGDFFLLSYAGHGGIVGDVDGDEEDGKDETWCLYNGQLLDDELSILWAEFEPGVRILVLSDSCHSGTVSKGIDADTLEQRNNGEAAAGDEVYEITRAMPIEVARDTISSNPEFYEQLQYDLPVPRPEIHASVRLISGCQDNEESYEVKDGHNGRFTDAIKTTYGNGRFEGDYHAFHQLIKEKVKRPPPLKPQTPNYLKQGAANEEFDQQKPFKI